MGILCRLILAVSAAGPPTVQIVTTPDPTAAQAAEMLWVGFGSERRWLRAPDIEQAASRAEPRPDISATQKLVDAAAHDYAALDAANAVAKASTILTRLMAWTDDAKAAQLAARALRIKGLAFLFLGDAQEAATAFVSAAFLHPDYTPGEQEWPPEARSAYGDAVAAANGRAPGILSLQVVPETATVWLDGRKIGTGSMTLPSVIQGEHLLLARSPGFAPMAAAITTAGSGKLTQAQLYLTALPAARARPMLLAALAAAFGTEQEALMARGVLRGSANDYLVLVTTAQGKPVAVSFNREGRRLGGPVVLTSLKTVAAIAALLPAQPVHTRVLEASLEPVSEAVPLYASWKLWVPVAAAVVAIGGGIAIIYAVTQPGGPEQVTFYVGRPR